MSDRGRDGRRDRRDTAGSDADSEVQPASVPANSPEVWRVAATAFCRLLETGAPVTVKDLADDLGLPARAVERAVAQAASASRLRLLPDGRVHGAHGLDVVPTRHAIFIERTSPHPPRAPLRLGQPGPRHTWCSYDVLGIMAALGASGHATSTSPWTGASITLRFADGQPEGGRAVLFLADGLDTARPEGWCPYVNFFESPQDAVAWSNALAVAGQVVSLQQGAELGRDRWRAVLGACG